MSVHRLPVYDLHDPRSGMALSIEANKYNRVVRIDSTNLRASLEPKDCATWYISPAEVIRFPTERTRTYGAL